MSKRFMIVEHVPKRGERLCIHHLLGTYHWHQIDDEHVVCVATHSMATHKELHSHHKVSVLPTLGSQKKLCHCLKGKHLNAVKKVFNLEDDHVSEHVLDALSEKYGPLFHA